MPRLPQNKYPSRSKKITPAFLRSWALPDPEVEGDKEARGAALVLAGQAGMPGAAILPGTAALRAGAGKLQIAVPEDIVPFVGLGIWEAMVLSLPPTANQLKSHDPLLKKVERARAVLIGPGMDSGAYLHELVEKILPRLRGATLVLDAGAMSCLKEKPGCLKHLEGRVIITPHAGEMSFLTGLSKEEIQGDPARVALEFSAREKVITVMKGSRTYIAGCDGELFHNDAGNVGLATSGSGDILSGIIVGLAARGAEPAQAAAWGVYLHACAGDHLATKIGPLGYLAHELLAEVPPFLKKLRA